MTPRAPSLQDIKFCEIFFLLCHLRDSPSTISDSLANQYWRGACLLTIKSTFDTQKILRVLSSQQQSGTEYCIQLLLLPFFIDCLFDKFLHLITVIRPLSKASTQAHMTFRTVNMADPPTFKVILAGERGVGKVSAPVSIVDGSKLTSY